MILLKNEEIIWESKNKRYLLTTHRIRKINKTIWGSSIKSILLNNLQSCELKTKRDPYFLKQAVIIFLFINAGVYIFNNYFFKSELMNVFYEDFHIGPEAAKAIFYTSILIASILIGLYFFSIKRVFFFHAIGTSISFQLRWLSFEERENFISKVEAAQNEKILLSKK